MKTTLILTLALLSVAAAVPSPRDEKVLQLFSVVHFQNVECQPITVGLTDIKGTCFSSSDCTAKNGVNSGKCASGFGVCCTFVIDAKTSGTVSHNNTVITNNGFPSALTTASQTATYTIKPVSTDICMLRFNFISFDLGIDTTTATAANTGKCLDTFVVSSPSGKAPPTICGKNNGQHIYSDVGMSSASITATVTTDTSTTKNRLWRIQIAQIECSNPNRPRTGCTQWFTATSGEFESFDFNSGNGVLMQTQDYNICFRTNGMCKLTIKEVAITTPDQFSLNDSTPSTTAVVGIGCNLARLLINGAAHCGAMLNSVTAGAASGSVSTGAPFTIGVFVPGGSDLKSSKGFHLAYSMSNTFCP